MLCDLIILILGICLKEIKIIRFVYIKIVYECLYKVSYKSLEVEII